MFWISSEPAARGEEFHYDLGAVRPFETRASPIRLCRKRPFAIHRLRRPQTGAAVCRIPCRILCLAYVARSSRRFTVGVPLVSVPALPRRALEGCVLIEGELSQLPVEFWRESEQHAFHRFRVSVRCRVLARALVCARRAMHCVGKIGFVLHHWSRLRVQLKSSLISAAASRLAQTQMRTIRL